MPLLIRDTKNNAVSGTSNAVTFAVSPNAGDLMISVCHHQSSAVPTPPAGWSAAVEETGLGGSHLRIFRKVAGAGESATVTWSFSASLVSNHGAYLISGNTAVPFHAAASANSGTTSVATLGTGTTTAPTFQRLLAIFALGGRATMTNRVWSFGTERIYSTITNHDLSIADVEIVTRDPVTSTMTWTGSTRAKGAVALFEITEPTPSTGHRRFSPLWRPC